MLLVESGQPQSPGSSKTHPLAEESRVPGALPKQGRILKDKLPEAWRKHFCSFLKHFDQDKINP